MKARLQSMLRNKLSVNSFWNLLGMSSGLIGAVIGIPLLVNYAGNERLGYITLAWAIVGYFGVFDFGISRALTHFVAIYRQENDDTNLKEIISTSIFLIFVIMVVLTCVNLAVVGLLGMPTFGLDNSLSNEAFSAGWLLIVTIPIVLASAIFKGILEGFEQFSVIAMIRAPLSIYSFVAPGLLSIFYPHLGLLIMVLFLGRLASALLLGLYACRACIISIRYWNTAVIRKLIGYGGWMTVSNVVAPLLLYVDRFIIAATVSLTATSFYVTPFEVTSKMSIVPQAIMGAAFPHLSAALGKDVRKGFRTIIQVWLAIAGILALPTLFFVFFSHWFFTLWLGAAFADNCHTVARLMAVGIFIHSLAQPSFYLIQAIGKPKVTATIHLLELSTFWIYLIFLLTTFGIEGAAIAWVIRVSISFILLNCAAYAVLKGKGCFGARTDSPTLETIRL